ncbi:MAG TPA: hypothetical protein DD640_06430 [Clostridiales bacterium]|nr:hypothetical protein [Clostridiales bacterium]
MVKVIVGCKGSGKTARLVDDLNLHAISDSANVVCIEVGRRLDRMVKYKIRLIDITEYPVGSYPELLSFIAGISAKDYDLTHVYIDSVTKVIGDPEMSGDAIHYDLLLEFLGQLEKFSANNNFDVMIILSADPANLPEGLRRYCDPY